MLREFFGLNALIGNFAVSTRIGGGLVASITCST
jgi:hypothetical protein